VLRCRALGPPPGRSRRASYAVTRDPAQPLTATGAQSSGRCGVG